MPSLICGNCSRLFDKTLADLQGPSDSVYCPDCQSTNVKTLVLEVDAGSSAKSFPSVTVTTLDVPAAVAAATVAPSAYAIPISLGPVKRKKARSKKKHVTVKPRKKAIVKPKKTAAVKPKKKAWAKDSL